MTGAGILVVFFLYLVIVALFLTIGGFILGWSFRKGWDRGAPRGP